MASKGVAGPVRMAPTDEGKLVIRETVLAEIAYLEAMGTPGVVAPHEGFLRRLLRGHKPVGVVVEIGADEVAFHLTVGMREGVRIPEAANELRRRVVAAVSTKTGYAVRSVNVLVDHIAFGEG